MAVSIDKLQIEIQGTARGANSSINRLVKNLNTLQGALQSVDPSKLSILATTSVKASTATNKASKSMDTLNTKTKVASTSFKGLSSIIGTFYASSFLLIRAFKGLWSSIESSTDYIEAFNYQRVAFGKIASDWKKDFEKYGYENAESYADSFNDRLQESFSKLSGVKFDEEGLRLVSNEVKNLGLNIQEVTQYASQLASVTNSVGLTGEASLAASTAFTKLAGDISSLFNVDYSSVATNLQSGLIGQSRALYKYGIDITQATLQTKAFELGLSKAVSEMTQGEKMQLRMISILEQSRVAWGDLANTINSPNNMIRIFQNSLKETGIVLGQLFIPILEKTIPYINGFTIALKTLLADVAGFLGIKIDKDKFGTGFVEMESDLEGVTEEFDQATDSAKKMKAQLQGFDKLNVLSTPKASGLGETIDLTEEILKATAEYEKVWNQAYEKMQNKAQEFANKIGGAFKEVREAFKAIGKGDWKQVGKSIDVLFTWLHNAVENFVKTINWFDIGKILGKMFQGFEPNEIAITFGRALYQVIKASALVMMGYLSSYDNPFLAVVDIIGKLIQMSATSVTHLIIGGVFQAFGEDFYAFVNSFKQKYLEPLFGQVRPVGERLSALFNGSIMIIKAAWSTVSGWFEKNVSAPLTSIFNNTSAKIKEAFAPLKEAIANPIIAGINWAIGILESGINSVIGGINKLFEGFNGLASWASKVLGKEWSGVKLIADISLPRIPKYQTGGFPEDGLFFANHNELVGKFSNGQTAVANNEQIISGITRGVIDANAEQNTLLREQNALLRQILAKDMGISSRDIFDAVRSEDRAYINRNGVSAFA